MRLTHRFRLPAPVEVAWPAFAHLERIAPCFPGAALSSTGPDTFRGTLHVKLGPVGLMYRGTGSYLERSPGRRVVLQARGDDTRGLGTAAARMRVELTARGTQTEVEVVTDLDLTGKPARYGAGVVAEVSDRLLDQFLSCLTARLRDGDLPSPRSAASARARRHALPLAVAGSLILVALRPRRFRARACRGQIS